MMARLTRVVALSLQVLLIGGAGYAVGTVLVELATR